MPAQLAAAMLWRAEHLSAWCVQDVVYGYSLVRSLAKAEQTFIPSRAPVLPMHFSTAVLLQPGRMYMLGVLVKVRCRRQPLDRRESACTRNLAGSFVHCLMLSCRRRGIKLHLAPVATCCECCMFAGTHLCLRQCPLQAELSNVHSMMRRRGVRD